MTATKEFLKRILNDEEFLSLIKNLSLTEKQLLDNRFLIEEIMEERKNCKANEIIPIVVIGSDDLLYKSYVLSNNGIKQLYLNNIKTQEVTKINFKINLSSVQQTTDRAEIGELLEKISKNHESINKGLYIYGSVGRGKTYISQAIANWLAKKGHTVGFVNTSELVSYFKGNFGTGNVEKIKNILKNVEFLFIDDIGAEPISEWFRDEIFLSILSSRMNNKMPTFYSSNYDYDKLLKVEAATPKKQYYSIDKATRLLERIKATSLPVRLLGKNYRY